MKLFSFKKKKPSSLPAESAKSFLGRTFGGKKRKKPTLPAKSVKEAPEKKTPVVSETPRQDLSGGGVEASPLLRPRITEKATDVAEKHNAYTFDVAKEASKEEIARAVKDIYKVNPIKVRVVRVPSKNVTSRGKRGVKAGGKKAYVYLKKGDTIEFV